MNLPLLEKLEQARQFIENKSSLRPLIGLTLGSGLSNFASEMKIDTEISYSAIPHFVPPTVDGHPGSLLLGHVKNIPVAVLQGRIHYYEGHNLEQVTFATRLLKFLGIKLLVLTNASGGLNPKMKPGDFMLIRDHINLTGENPLRGPNVSELGPRFPDMSEPYSKEFTDLLAQICKKNNFSFMEGIYCGVQGPSYETAAEVRYLHKIGGDAVGMSTVPETLVARHMGLKTVGVSCITNLATGLSSQQVTHEEVKEVAARVEKQFAFMISEFVGQAGAAL